MTHLYKPSSSTLTQSSVSEKRTRLYKTLTEISDSTQQTKRQKTSDTKSNTTSSPADYQTITDSDLTCKRELHLSDTAKKFSDLTMTNLYIMK